ncbi:MAG: aminotransferase class I/II-fold pyridoxal phosphate-dependent enzyme [Bacilli bacterium]
MKDYLAKRVTKVVASNDILQISAKAKEASKKEKVIDASIGQFLAEDKSLVGLNEIKQALSKYLPDNLGYPSSLGSQEYQEAILKWLFKTEYNTVNKTYQIPFAATLGGTGACSLAFKTFLDEGETVLLPSVMWSNYRLIAKEATLKSATYPLFKGQHFNIDGLIKKINSLKQRNVLVVINDPCENPTGYSLSSQEYKELITKLNEVGKKRNLAILFDIAYLDFDHDGKSMHHLFKELLAKKLNFLPLFAFSCSKTFGVYGLRVGALFALSKGLEFKTDLCQAWGNFARGTYSCPNGGALAAISKALLDPNSMNKIQAEICTNSMNLQLRGKYLIEQLEKNKISYLPYCNGFFVTIIVKDTSGLTKKLEKQHIYVVPLDSKHIRLAVSGLNKEDIQTICQVIGGLENA